MVQSFPVIEDLRRLLGPEAVVTDEDIVASFCHDMSGLEGSALGVVRPETAEQVVSTVVWAVDHGVPIVARGAGTSLDGESVPAPGSLVVDFGRRMNRILEINQEDMYAAVQPGVVNRSLNLELERHGLFFPPNPGSWETSTIGGNAATNAAGPRSFKYSSTRNWVTALECVLGSGELIELGTLSRKRSSGPELVKLLIGSEGTLGLFTKLVLRLAPLPEKRTGVILPLNSVKEASSVVVNLALRPELGISALEFVDEKCLAALNGVYSSGIPECRAALMIEIESKETEYTDRLAELLEITSKYRSAHEPLFENDVNSMWDLRGRITFALERVYGKQYRDDIAVPVTRFPELVAGVQEIFEAAGLNLVVFGHAGDGNLHLEFDSKSLSDTALSDILGRTYALATSLGGTISGEHGIGKLKRKYYALDHSSVEIQLLKRIKQAFDPEGILNPGNLYP